MTHEKSLYDQGKSSKFAFTFFISFAISKLFGIAFTKIFTNVLSKDEMGFYAIILSAVGLIMTFSTVGFPSSLNRYTIKYKISDEKQNLKNFIFSGFIMFLVVEAIIILGIFIGYLITNEPIYFLDIENYVLSVFLVAGIVLAQIFSTMASSISSSLQNGRFYAIIIIMRVLLQLPFGILFVLYFNWGVFGLVASLALSEISVSIFCIYTIIRDIGIGKFSFKELKKIFEFAFPVHLTGILWFGFDLAILLYLDYVDPVTGTETVALYRYGALTVVNIILLAGNLFRMAYWPIIYKNFEKGKHQFMQDFTNQILKIYLIIFFPFALLIYAFSHLLIPFFTLAEYLPSIPVIPLLLVSVLFQYAQGLVAYGNALYFKNYWNLIVGSISFILACLAAYFIIPYNGLIGLGVAYVVRKFFYFLGMVITSQRYFKVHYQKVTLISLTATMIISAGVGVIFKYFVFDFLIDSTNLLISYSLSAVIFILLIVIFRILNKEDLRFIYDIFKNYLKNIN
ncbi:MAG: lipopolysaccharide biosynthesis protein, partial [Candidatus Heimdallarchaeota archaeon]|nr:lipopolysaccharide biosynthesis protein [Candidatus Heimdallarchaeota archaeon]MCK4253967.1 lipopolysaccharide biosynthesis protein [Candidatus Heimdallarchaeota archaeon]